MILPHDSPNRQAVYFHTYGEFAFLIAETMLVFALIYYYQYEYITMVVFVVVTVAFCGVLFSGIINSGIMGYLFWFAVACAFVGKLMQVYRNFANKHTGQLSNFTLYILTVIGIIRLVDKHSGEGARFSTGDLLRLAYRR